MKIKVYVTKKGADMQTNAWKEGQELNVPELTAEEFVNKGVATYGLDAPEEKQSKTKKK